MTKQNFTIYRLTTTAGSKREYTATAEKLFGILEPMDAEFGALAGMAFGKSFRIFTQKMVTTVKEGDRLRSAKGIDYDVKGVIRYEDHFPKHVEIMVETAIKQT